MSNMHEISATVQARINNPANPSTITHAVVQYTGKGEGGSGNKIVTAGSRDFCEGFILCAKMVNQGADLHITKVREARCHEDNRNSLEPTRLTDVRADAETYHPWVHN